MVGGIAFLTTLINGTTAGTLVKKLGMTKPAEFEEKLYNGVMRSVFGYIEKTINNLKVYY